VLVAQLWSALLDYEDLVRTAEQPGRVRGTALPSVFEHVLTSFGEPTPHHANENKGPPLSRRASSGAARVVTAATNGGGSTTTSGQAPPMRRIRSSETRDSLDGALFTSDDESAIGDGVSDRSAPSSSTSRAAPSSSSTTASASTTTRRRSTSPPLSPDTRHAAEVMVSGDNNDDPDLISTQGFDDGTPPAPPIVVAESPVKPRRSPRRSRSASPR
jgi:hypothetical protein